MKFYQIPLLLLVLVIALCSCEKQKYKNKFYGEGKVVEYGKIRNPIPNATVVLYEVSGEILGSTTFVPIDSTTTDADGFYRLSSEKANPDAVFHLEAFADPTQFKNSTDEQYEGNVPDYGQKNVNTLFIRPYAFVKVNVKNVNPVDDEDRIGIWGNWGGSVADEVFYHGTHVNDSFVRRILGNDSTEVNYELQRTNLPTYYNEKKYFAKSHDTLKININY